jgi:two-component system LytT family response regulator
MAIPLKNKIEIIAIDRILYLKSDSNYTEIHMDDGKKIIRSTTLKRYASKLCSNRFIRVHNSYLINATYLTSYLSKLNKIVLQNLQEIPVSNGRKEGLLNYLKTLMV